MIPRIPSLPPLSHAHRIRYVWHLGMFMEIYVTIPSAVNHVLTRKVCNPGAWISRSLHQAAVGPVGLPFYLDSYMD